jgi:hypothetical protein
MNAHFGLGTNATADSVRITWPSGTAQTLTNVAGDRYRGWSRPTERPLPQALEHLSGQGARRARVRAPRTLRGAGGAAPTLKQMHETLLRFREQILGS